MTQRDPTVSGRAVEVLRYIDWLELAADIEPAPVTAALLALDAQRLVVDQAFRTLGFPP